MTLRNDKLISVKSAGDARLDTILSLVPRFGLEILLIGVMQDRYNLTDVEEYQDALMAVKNLPDRDKETLADIFEAILGAVPEIDPDSRIQ